MMSSNNEFQSRHAGAFDLSGSQSDPLEDKLKRLCFEYGYNTVRSALHRLGAENGVEVSENMSRSPGQARWATRIKKEIEQAAREGVQIDEKEASRRVSARMRQGASDSNSSEPGVEAAA